MFRLRPDAAPAAGGDRVTVEVEGRTVRVPQGASAAAAVLLAGLSSIRDTADRRRRARALLHDGGVLRLPCRDRRRAQPPELHDRGPTRHAHPPPARPAPSRDVVMTADLAVADLMVVGAGPAGMAASVLASELGLDTVLLDEQDSPGGQIYRAIERAGEGGPQNSPLGADYLAGRPLAASLRASRVRYRPGMTVWHIDPGGEGGGVTVSVAGDDGGETIAARRILLATGAIERPVPIPGWTLPGVMTAGAAQILLKTADLVPDGRTVIAGQGPLLYLAAMQLARAGAPPVAVLETTPRENYAAAMRHVAGWWAGRRDLGKGLSMIAELRRLGVPVRRGRAEAARLGRRRDRKRRLAWRRNRRRSPAAA